MSTLKQQLYNHCLDYIEKRIQTVKATLLEAQDASRHETKSSAGDKYETGRAMAQLEIEKNSVQLSEAIKLKQVLESLRDRTSTDSIQAGNVVVTNQGNYFLAIPAGQWLIDHKTYFAISVQSPIGKAMIGLSAGSSFQFHDKEYRVEAIL